MREYKAQAFGENEKHLFFAMDGETAQRHGAVGYMRLDFGTNGSEFWTTWFDNQKHLNTPAFKDSLSDFVNHLRYGILKNRVAMNVYNNDDLGVSLGERGMGYKVDSGRYTFYLRCNPGRADYDAYCFAYENRYLLPELAGQHELPFDCVSLLPSTNEIIYIMQGQNGSYRPYSGSTSDPDVNRQMVDGQNQKMGVTRRQEEAMLAGSLFGWDTPAAKPWNYDAVGNPRPLPPKNKDNHER